MKKSENNPRKVKKNNEQKRQPSRANRILGIVAVSVLLLLVIGGLVGVRVAGKKISEGQTILPNVYVGKVCLADMTEQEAVKALEEQGWDEAIGGVLKIDLPMDIHFSLDYYKAGAAVTAEEAAASAFRYGHDGSDAENLMTYLRLLSGPKELSTEAGSLNTDYIREQIAIAAKRFADATADKGYVLDEEAAKIIFVKGAGQMRIDEEELYAMIEQALRDHERTLRYELPERDYPAPDFEALYEQLAVATTDAYYDPETDSIVPDTKGVTFDVAEAERMWNAAAPGEEVVISMTMTAPEVTAEELEELLFRDCLGAQMTHYWGSSSQRINNLDLVAQKLNGMVLMPGEEFSYNGYVGERTEAAGFQAAQAYADGQVVYEIGGGVCQVSSTLYNAVLKANLEIVYRECHYFPVNYLPKGLDATVSWPKPDFRFLNNRDYPIRLKAWIDRPSQALNIEIWGSNVDGTYVVPVSDWWPIYDDEYPTVQIGWGAASWRVIYNADGVEIDRIYEANSVYYLHDEDIQWPPEKFEPETPDDITIDDPESSPDETASPAPSDSPPAETPAPSPGEDDSTIITG